MLKLNSIEAGYGDLQVLRGIDLEVQQGEIVSLIGANGAGKTTIMKSIMGLVRLTGGSIVFEGEQIDLLPPYRIPACGLSLVPEGRLGFAEMTVLENLELGTVTKQARLQARETMDHVFELFPVLHERRLQRAGTLSGGELQMLVIGRGLMSRPRLLLLDEPSLGIAPKLVEHIFERLRVIASEGVTILIAEQNVVDALSLSARAYVVEQGAITLHGSASELMRDDRVREAFLGL